VGEGDTEQEVARKDTPEGIQEEEVTVEDQKTQKKTIDDRQVVKSVEVFDVDMDGDSITVEVKTNLDGSRIVTKKTKDGVAKENLSKDNPMSNADYVTKTYGTIKDSKTKPITEVMSQKKIDRLSSEQKKAIGLKEKLEKVTTEKVNKLVTAPRRITEPFTIGRVQVLFNEDGSIKSIINKSGKKKGKEVAASTREKYEKIILEKVIDIDAGEKAQAVEGLQPEQVAGFIADESTNVREVAQAVKDEQSRIEKNKEQQQELIDEQDLTKLIDLKFTSESWQRLTGKTPKQSKIDKVWIDDSFDVMGNPVGLSLEDGWLSEFSKPEELPVDTGKRLESLGITVDDVIQFIKENNTPAKIGKAKKIKRTPKTPGLIDLELKFEKLTGAKPTPTNIDLVIGIEEGRVPAELLKLQEQEQLSQPAIDEKGS